MRPATRRLLGAGFIAKTPPRLSIRQIGDDFILGIWRDELEVEHLRLFDLIKPDRDP